MTDSLVASEGEYLDPGFDAQTPPGDNLLNDFCRAEVEAWERWAHACGGRHGRDDALGVAWTDTSCPSLFGNPVHWSRPLDAAQAARALAIVRGEFAKADGGPFLLYSAFPTPDLRAERLGPIGHPPLMMRPPGGGPGARTDLRVERASDVEQLHDFERTLAEAYPVPDVLPWSAGCLVGAPILDDDRWHLFVGYAGDRAVGTSAAYVSDELVDVTLVSARPEARGRGYGAALTWAATLADPAKPAMLIASDDGRSVYARMGYLTLMRFTLWSGSRA